MKNTSILFDMSQESFEHIDIAHDEYKCMCLIFDLYTSQQNTRDIWAKTLWSELKPQLLLEGMDNFIKEYKHLPKSCRSLPIGLVLEANMKKFKSSIPLLIELKNGSMREEHWKKLMDKTGELPKPLKNCIKYYNNYY